MYRQVWNVNGFNFIILKIRHLIVFLSQLYKENCINFGRKESFFMPWAKNYHLTPLVRKLLFLV